MGCMFDFLNVPYVVSRYTYDPIMIHILIIIIQVKFQRGNKIFKPIIIAKHIFLRGPILNLGAIIDRPLQNLAI